MEVRTTWYSIAVIILSIVVDYSRSRALKRVATETHSQALEADALHFSSDIWSSCAVLSGLGGVYLGITWADSAAAVAVAVFVGMAGFKLGKRTVDVLVDAAPDGLKEQVVEIAGKVDGVLDIAKIRVRPVGSRAFIDMIINVSRRLSLERTQSICRAVEHRIRQSIPEADLSVNAKPISPDNETVVESLQVLAANHGLSVHNVAIHTSGATRRLTFDLEVDNDLSIRQAHEIATSLENEIKSKIDAGFEIITHIEPVKAEIEIGNRIEKSRAPLPTAWQVYCT